jgi:hypothetical protein
MIVTSVADVCEYYLEVIGQAMIDCDRPDISTAYVGVGEIPADDCCGMLVVTPEQVYRYQEFPSSFETAEFCQTGLIAVTLLVTVGRCVPVLDERGRFPSSESLNQAHRVIMDDAAVVWSRVNGELPDDWERSGVTQTFAGPLGGCVICETRFTIGLDQSVLACCQETL